MRAGPASRRSTASPPSIVEAHAVDHRLVALPARNKPAARGFADLRLRRHRPRFRRSRNPAATNAFRNPPRSCRSLRPCRPDWESFRPKGPHRQFLDRRCAAVPVAAAASPGSPDGARLPGRASANSGKDRASKAADHGASSGMVVIAIGTRVADRATATTAPKIKFAVEMWKTARHCATASHRSGVGPACRRPTAIRNSPVRPKEVFPGRLRPPAREEKNE